MASSNSLVTLQKHYLRIIRNWPKDVLRSVTFQGAMATRLEYKFRARLDPQSFDEQYEQGQVNALYSLLENRYAQQYPASEQMMRPASNPDYYQALAAEMEAAPSRSWLMNKWLRLKGLTVNRNYKELGHFSRTQGSKLRDDEDTFYLRL